jgi:myo-inositol-1(or 4)-monophosphatase
MKEYMKVFEHLMHNTHGLRRLGSAAVDLAYVACGRFEGFYEYGLNAWDVAAGAIIVKEAGGKVSDFSGGTNFVFGREIIASNKKSFDELLSVIQKNFN